MREGNPINRITDKYVEYIIRKLDEHTVNRPDTKVIIARPTEAIAADRKPSERFPVIFY